MSSATFNGPFTETLVARVAGVKKSVLANVRRGRLAKGMPPGAGVQGDWFLDAKAQVNYTRAGLSVLLTGLGISMESFLKQAGAEIDFKAGRGADAQTPVADREIEASAGADSTVPATVKTKPVIVADLTVDRVIGKKRLRARLPHGGLVALLVKESANFMPGMVCQGCRRADDGVGPWSFLGKLPRRRGRW